MKKRQIVGLSVVAVCFIFAIGAAFVIKGRKPDQVNPPQKIVPGEEEGKTSHTKDPKEPEKQEESEKQDEPGNAKEEGSTSAVEKQGDNAVSFEASDSEKQEESKPAEDKKPSEPQEPGEGEKPIPGESEEPEQKPSEEDNWTGYY